MKTTYTLITGASSGIGKALATIAAHEGRNLILVARGKESLTSLAQSLTKQYGVYAEVVACDLTDASSPQLIYDLAERKKLVVDILVNNAGFGDYGVFVETDRATQLSMVDLNIRALTELTHLFLPGMVARRDGRIMNVGSIASFLPGPLMSVYFATKAFVLSFSEALAAELRDSGVSVTCLCPGSTKTEFGRTAHVSENHSTRTSHVTAEQVASFGWEELLRGKTVAIYGTGNKISIILSKFLPRRVVARLVEYIQK